MNNYFLIINYFILKNYLYILYKKQFENFIILLNFKFLKMAKSTLTINQFLDSNENKNYFKLFDENKKVLPDITILNKRKAKNNKEVTLVDIVISIDNKKYKFYGIRNKNSFYEKGKSSKYYYSIFKSSIDFYLNNLKQKKYNLKVEDSDSDEDSD